MSKFVHAAATALLLFASPAAADPFQSFLKACVTTNGEAAAAATAVRALGWKPMPAEAISEGMPVGLENAALYVNFDPQGDTQPDSIEVLMTGQANGETVLDARDVIMSICGVVAPGIEGAALTGEATVYFGGAPETNEDGYTLWIYSLQNGLMTPESDLAHAEDDAILAAVRQRPLFAVFTVDEDGAAGLMLGAFRSTKGAAGQD